MQFRGREGCRRKVNWGDRSLLFLVLCLGSKRIDLRQVGRGLNAPGGFFGKNLSKELKGLYSNYRTLNRNEQLTDPQGRKQPQITKDDAEKRWMLSQWHRDTHKEGSCK